MTMQLIYAMDAGTAARRGCRRLHSSSRWRARPPARAAPTSAAWSPTTREGALPGVTITLVNTNTGATQVLVTGPEGNYRAVNLQPGPYSITAEIDGLRAQQADGHVARGLQQHHQHHARRGDPVRERHRERGEPAGRSGQGAAAVGHRRRATRRASGARSELPGAGAAPAGRRAAHRREQPVRRHQVRRAGRPAQRLHDDPRRRRHRRFDVGQPGHQHDRRTRCRSSRSFATSSTPSMARR